VRNKFLRVVGLYGHYDDSEDIFSIPMMLHYTAIPVVSFL
jgi:hypothetical protein